MNSYKILFPSTGNLCTTPWISRKSRFSSSLLELPRFFNRMSVLQKKDRESVTDLLTNAKQVVSSVQDVARKLADYAKFKGDSKFLDIPAKKDSIALPGVPATTISAGPVPVSKKEEFTCKIPELFVPGTVYCLRRHVDTDLGTNHGKAGEFFTLWKRHPGEHVQRILLSSNVLSDHKCDNHYYALRDVLKGLPGSDDEGL